MKRLQRNVHISTWIGIVFTMGVAIPGSRAATITPQLNAFVFHNASADGSVDIAPNSLSFVLTGGNTGSGIPGTTDFTAIANVPGMVSFTYSYATLDPSPGYDLVGYILGTTRFQLASTDGQAGPGSFAITKGQLYGWYADTLDNTGEPGVLTVGFNAPSAVPEPAGFALSLTGVAIVFVLRSRVIYVFRQGARS